ncbi:tetratricopeptide repeat-containing sensor histidine kinase [Winogradskyella ursingii]|uniref:tetratricopeptide repeat-containing sensor histidine kinase n=1 Tax=Winogradskyella ursingii TaxID=2686079 RepID=UPI0015C927CA|nr:tetratricopeptide repeat protein [Winogradskyella ursingii]
MRCLNLKSIIKLSTLYLYLILCYFSSEINAQSSDFKVLAEKISRDQPISYNLIDSTLNAFKRDSLKMKVFLDASKKNAYKEGASYALNALGVIQRNISNYEKSIELHQKANSYADQADNDELRIISLNMIGVAYRRMDIIKPALDYHTEALDIAYSVSDPSEIVTYNIAVSQNSIGNIYLALQQYDLAITQFNKSLKIESQSSNKLGLAINYHNIGYAEEAKGNLDAALANYETSLDYNNAIDSEIGRVICENSIGGIYIKKEQFAKAEPIIKRALEKALKLGDQFYISSSYINLGQLEIGLNRWSAAERNLKKALEVAEAYNLNSSIAESKKLLAQVSEQKNDYKTALQQYQEAVAIESTILTEQNLQYVNDIVISYENEIKNNQIEALALENEAVNMRLERNRKILLYSLFALVIFIASFIIINRTRALRHEKQILLLEQDMMRSQMNPHFIFNSLNSIKLYIINNEKENAVYYLNKFSKLIRKILIASKEKETSLSDELETMQLYMNIENIRFSNEIEFEVNIDNTINTEVVKVPSLILQPFLENALWHGLSAKPEDKKITLNVFKNSNDYITIEIIDNGIGRIASSRIKANKKLKRKSVGIELTKARLANFSKGFSNTYSLLIMDLYSKDEPIGTNVTLRIPTKS